MEASVSRCISKEWNRRIETFLFTLSWEMTAMAEVI